MVGPAALSRAQYIRQANERMNRETEQEMRARRLIEASCLVSEESMRANAEFDAIESDPDSEWTAERSGLLFSIRNTVRSLARRVPF